MVVGERIKIVHTLVPALNPLPPECSLDTLVFFTFFLIWGKFAVQTSFGFS